MIKKLLLNSSILLFGTFSGTAQIQSLPFFESFEDNSATLSQWTQIYEVRNMSWTYESSASTGSYGVGAYDGSRFANFPADSFSYDRTKLVSPPLSLTNYTNLNLEFYYINPSWGSDLNWIRVYYRTSATAAWQQVLELHQDVRSWRSTGAINLPSDTYQFAIESESDYGYSTLIDAVRLEGTLSLNKNFDTTFKIYPNPAADVLHIVSEEAMESVRIFNLLGQIVYNKNVNAGSETLNIGHLNSGTYFVEIKNAKGIHTEKIIKK